MRGFRGGDGLSRWVGSEARGLLHTDFPPSASFAEHWPRSALSARCFCIARGSGGGGTCAVAGDDGHAYFADSVRRDGWGADTGSHGEFSGQHSVILSATIE